MPTRRLTRLTIFLVVATGVLLMWVVWWYGFAPETFDRLPNWLTDVLGLITGAGFITLALLWVLVGWQRRKLNRSHFSSMTLQQLHALSPRDFERYVAELFERRGYMVVVRGRTGDLGVDLEVVRPDGRRAIVQCKRYRHAIGPDIVRELFGTMVHEMAHHGFLVTTAPISSAARQWAKGKPITLIDGPTLVQLPVIMPESLL